MSIIGICWYTDCYLSIIPWQSSGWARPSFAYIEVFSCSVYIRYSNSVLFMTIENNTQYSWSSVEMGFLIQLPLKSPTVMSPRAYTGYYAKCILLKCKCVSYQSRTCCRMRYNDVYRKCDILMIKAEQIRMRYAEGAILFFFRDKSCISRTIISPAYM